METQKFWSRIGHWFKKSDSPSSMAGFDGQSVALGETAGRVAEVEADIAVTATADPPKAPSLFRRSRTHQDLERLEAQYTRVGNLMDSIERHMESQADRSERIACSLDRLAQNLTGVPEAFRHQLEVLSSIRETVTTEQDRASRIEESLSQWPRVADAQRETMVSISRQLDESRESNTRMASTVEECSGTFARVGETAAASTKAIERFAGDAAANTERVARLLEVQAGQFRVFAWSAIGLAGVAALVAIISLLQ